MKRDIFIIWNTYENKGLVLTYHTYIYTNKFLFVANKHHGK